MFLSLFLTVPMQALHLQHWYALSTSHLCCAQPDGKETANVLSNGQLGGR